jgi:hypothetical protein
MAYLDRVFENASEHVTIPNALTFTGATVFSGTMTFTAPNKVNITTAPLGYTVPVLSVGTYSSAVVDAALIDNIAFTVNMATATNKTDADSSCIAAYIKVANTAATTNNKIQGLLVSNALGFNCFDAYAVQGHITVGAGGVSTQNANAHIAGISGKALLTGAVGQGWVTGLLGIIDGTGAVTGLCHAIAGQVEATTTANACDAVLYLGADQTVPTAIEFAGTANMTNIFKFNAVAGGVVANALVPAEAPSGTTVGADAALVCDIGGTPYYIPLYNTLHGA